MLLNDKNCTVLILYYAKLYCTLYYYTDTRQYRGLWFILFTPHSIYTISTLSFTLSTLSRIYSNYSIYSPTLLYSTLPTRLYSLLSTVYSIVHTLYSSLLYPSPLYSTLLYSTLPYGTVPYCTVSYHTILVLQCAFVNFINHVVDTMANIGRAYNVFARVGQQCASKLLDSPPAFEQRGLVIWMRKKRTTNPDASESLLLYFFWRV